jgi:shikimate dehydrogenase
VPKLALAVLGDPIDHSLSPVIHMAAMAFLGIEGSYRAIRADNEVLEGAVADLREGALDGFNVTMPLKGAAFRLAERLTHEAADAGSVNTMRYRDGAVEGHSSDLVAMADLIGRLDPSGHAPVLVLGSGGAAAAALAACRGRRTLVAARSPDRAEVLADRLGGIETARWGEAVPGALLVNATPLGSGVDFLPAGVLEGSEAVIDLPYGVEPTSTVLGAAKAGIPFVDGIEFLVAQACVSFQWWTGVDPPVRVMLEAARNT